jgi:hypothetical protein
MRMTRENEYQDATACSQAIEFIMVVFGGGPLGKLLSVQCTFLSTTNDMFSGPEKCSRATTLQRDLGLIIGGGVVFRF